MVTGMALINPAIHSPRDKTLHNLWVDFVFGGCPTALLATYTQVCVRAQDRIENQGQYGCRQFS